MFHELCLEPDSPVNPGACETCGAATSVQEVPVRPTISVLDDDLLARIVDEAKRVLAEVGLEVRGQTLRERLLASGLQLDARGERVLFPPEVVEEALRQAPSSFTLCNRASGSPSKSSPSR